MEAATELRRVVFTRYKALGQFRLDVRQVNVLVGPNNCGKSTVLSAFRVLGTALSKARRRSPEILSAFGESVRGYHIPNSELPIAAANVHTDLVDSDTSIVFEFQNKSQLILSFPEDGGCMLFTRNCDRTPTTPAVFKRAFPFTVDHIPTLGPFDSEERLVQPETVRRGLNTHRAAGHFRNYWYQNREDFNLFAERLRATWAEMDILPPEIDYGGEHPALYMMCTEKRMSREVFWAGFGFQVWCQLLTHLVRTRESSLIVVDEPEIYLHADLQRQLMDILRGAGPSVILATHSSEIISEAEPNEIVIVDKRKTAGRRIRKAAQVQDALDVLGSTHNLTLTRIARSRRICFVEGKDARLLRMFARKMKKSALADSDDVIFVPIDGFTSWTSLDAMKWAFTQALGNPLNFAVVLDRDFRSNEEISEIRGEVEANIPLVHIHLRKEIENYFLVPAVLNRLIDSVSGETNAYSKIMQCVSEELEDSTLAQYLARHGDFAKKNGIDPSTTFEATTRWFRQEWSAMETRMRILPGKKCLSLINREVQGKFNATLTPSRIVGAMRTTEIPEELAQLIESLEDFRCDKAT